MRKLELERALGRIRTARDAANWQGLFTAEIRGVTFKQRRYQIANPLDEAIAIIEKELDRLPKKRKGGVPFPRVYRAPYKD